MPPACNCIRVKFEMPSATERSVLAFSAGQLLARGPLSEVALRVFDSPAHQRGELVLLFDADTGRQFDIDLSGDREAIAARHAPIDAEPVSEAADESAPKRRGRPRLGVVGREVTLLPRHWEWLESQRGGASATLRRLVDEARKATAEGEARRHAQDRCQRIMSVLAGDLGGFEEAARALYAGDGERFAAETSLWPADVRAAVLELAQGAFEDAPAR